jgi:DNA repair exonuclease SbcCD nuclease subunit
MGSFRFIHTGDIHLDSPLKGLAGQQSAAAERIRTATRTAFSNLIDVAIEDEVDFVIIAGDLYDGDWRDYQTGLFFISEMGRLAKGRIPAFVLYGNHDAENQITKRLTLPDNVRVFSTRKPETIRMDGCTVALHGQSFRQRAVTENLVPTYPQPVDGCFNIGVLHTGLGGIDGHANYAPCSLDDLVNKGYDYWALAHVHNGGVLHVHPHVVFCGNLQGRHVRESGAKGATLVSVQDGVVRDVSTIETDVVRWTRLAVDVEGTAHCHDVIDRIRTAMEEKVAKNSGRLLACRIELTGRTALHDEISCSHERLIAEARAAALALGDEAAWVERLVIETTAAADALVPAIDALGELQEIVAEAPGDADLCAQLDADIGELVRKLPHEIKIELEDGILKAAADRDHQQLISRASRYLAARLSQGV